MDFAARPSKESPILVVKGVRGENIHLELGLEVSRTHDEVDAGWNEREQYRCRVTLDKHRGWNVDSVSM